MCSVSGCLAQFLLFSISVTSFTCSASGWPGCSQWGVCAVFVVVLLIFSRSRPLGWAALALQRAAPKVCKLFWGVYCDLGESSTLLRLTWYLAGKYALIGIFCCLGVCAGMWIISRGIYFGMLVLSFISVLLF